jgi:hypothetical protein
MCIGFWEYEIISSSSHLILYFLLPKSYKARSTASLPSSESKFMAPLVIACLSLKTEQRAWSCTTLHRSTYVWTWNTISSKVILQRLLSSNGYAWKVPPVLLHVGFWLLLKYAIRVVVSPREAQAEEGITTGLVIKVKDLLLTKVLCSEFGRYNYTSNRSRSRGDRHMTVNREPLAGFRKSRSGRLSI